MGDSKDVDLTELFKDVPDDALIVRKITRSGINAWQWFITGVAVVYLVYLLARIGQWMIGSRGSHSAGPDRTTGSDADAPLAPPAPPELR